MFEVCWVERLLSLYLIHKIWIILKSQRRAIFLNLVFCNNQKSTKNHLVYKKEILRSSFAMFSQHIGADEFAWYEKSGEKKKQHDLYVFLTILGLKFHKSLT